MHGHGYAPQQPQPPSGGTHVTLRVLFVVLAVITCGLLAWAAMLRLAYVTRKSYDWVLFGLVTALDVTALVLIGVDPGEEEFQSTGNAGMVIMLCTMVAALAYYLYADIRHFSPYRQRQFTGHLPPQTQPAYGYPQQPAPAPGPLHQQPTRPPFQPAPPAQQTPPPHGHQTPPPHAHQTPPPPTRPAPARINQVRAELDELSDYLRKQEGGS
ncbi:hypothetical protein AB0B50_33165 [Streptomyces sp. NPDC041068]|uniref:hypothetical protein n=1 Tax=Streptomyces sp. NPDC041068 TaxID=3155130 RepID=UPI0033C7B408